MPNPLDVYISYAEEDIIFRDNLVKHLSALVKQQFIKVWHKGLATLGLDPVIESNTYLINANIYVVLVSPDYLNSDNWDTELPHAIKRANEGVCLLLPVLIRPCDYYNIPKEKVVPRNSVDQPLAINKWGNQDDAFEYVVGELKRQMGFFLEVSPRKLVETNYNEENNSLIRLISESLKNGELPFSGINVDHTALSSEGNTQIGHKVKIVFKNPKMPSASPPNTQSSRRQLPPNAKTVWKKIPISDDVDKLALLELDRKKEFIDQLICDFNINSPSHRNLFYFIGACHSQYPEIIARRFVLHCQQNLMNSYIMGTDCFDQLSILNLIIKQNPEETFNQLWNFVKNKLPNDWKNKIPQDKDFEGFIDSIPIYLPNTFRFPIIMIIKENQWQKPVETHLEYIAKQFMSIPEANRRFVFIVILEIGEFHTCHCQEGHEVFYKKQKIINIQSVMEEIESNAHFFWLEIIDYIHFKDIENWLRQIIHSTADFDRCLQILITSLLHEMNEDEARIAKEDSYFINATRLSQYQRTAYNELIKKTSRHAL
ncbi:MAG: toll/interleukin-1 receptor domain-containing protein [Saprospiraceae bacterium]|nr:toll/interleukin-1 receptor domain-containing protein [Saprospiraceae bacterium]